MTRLIAIINNNGNNQVIKLIYPYFQTLNELNVLNLTHYIHYGH